MEKNILIKCIACFLGLYIIQFLVIPMLFPNYFPRSNNATVIFLVTSIIGSVVAITFITSRLKDLWKADLFYGCMLCLFNGNGKYGIGRVGLNLDGLQSRMSFQMALLSSIVIVIGFFIMQAIIVRVKKALVDKNF